MRKPLPSIPPQHMYAQSAHLQPANFLDFNTKRASVYDKLSPDYGAMLPDDYMVTELRRRTQPEPPSIASNAPAAPVSTRISDVSPNDYLIDYTKRNDNIKYFINAQGNVQYTPSGQRISGKNLKQGHIDCSGNVCAFNTEMYDKVVDPLLAKPETAKYFDVNKLSNWRKKISNIGMNNVVNIRKILNTDYPQNKIYDGTYGQGQLDVNRLQSLPDGAIITEINKGGGKGWGRHIVQVMTKDGVKGIQESAESTGGITWRPLEEFYAARQSPKYSKYSIQVHENPVYKMYNEAQRRYAADVQPKQKMPDVRDRFNLTRRIKQSTSGPTLTLPKITSESFAELLGDVQQRNLQPIPTRANAQSAWAHLIK
jgi:hypothetical protein